MNVKPLVLSVALLLCACATPANKPSVYNVDDTILTDQFEFNHYKGDPEDVYHRTP